MALDPLSLLPADLMEAQLSTVDLLMAMYPSPGELEIPDDTTHWIEKLRNWCENPVGTPSGVPSRISLAVRLPITGTDKTIHTNISIPLEAAVPWNYTLRQPEWMSKAEVARLAANIPPGDDVLTALQYVQEEAQSFLESQHTAQSESSTSPKRPMVRVWFYLPSLSSREKRDDLVNHAPDYMLTGFVLAGKPGVLCLEGESKDIDSYMSFIKTHSWGDIPSHQKKISERFRETNGVQRVFSNMEEITDTLGARGGQRANRGDMQALEAWLEERGLGEAFEKVIF